MVDHREIAKETVDHHHAREDDRKANERERQESSARTRDYLDKGDLAAVAAEMGMPDLGVRIAEDKLDQSRYGFDESSSRQTARVRSTLDTAVSYLKDKKYFRAELELNFLASAGDPEPAVHFFYGIALFFQEKYADALSSMERARTRGATNLECIPYIARSLLHLDQPGKAVVELSQVLDEGSGNAELYALRAEGLMRLRGSAEQEKQRVSAAADDMHQAVQAQPGNSYYRLQYAHILLFNNCPDQAIAEANAAEKLGLINPELCMIKGRAFSTTGKPDEAVKAYSFGIALKSKWTPLLLRDRFNLLSNQGRFEEAIADVTELIKLHPRRIENYIDRGDCYMRQGDYKTALTDFRAAQKLAKRSPQPPYHIARCLLAMGQIGQAKKSVQLSLELGPGYAPAQELLRKCRDA